MLVGHSGFSRVHRQDIVGWSFAFGPSHYQLVGPAGWVAGGQDQLTPHPDYFTTILWKQLVGSRILHTNVTGDVTAQGNFEGHFWCTAATAPGGLGHVVLAWSNSGASDITLTLPVALANLPATVYLLTNTASGSVYSALQADQVFLNGKVLFVGDDGMLPEYPIPGETGTYTSVNAGAYSYGFIVFNGALQVAACS